MAVTYENYKPIRNRIRKFDANTLVSRSVHKLHEIKDFDTLEFKGWSPWNLLLLIKWTLLDGHFESGRKPATFDHLAALVKMTHDLFGIGRMPSEYSSTSLFAKNLIFQQEWLQRRPSMADVGRQIELFVRSKERDRIDEIFTKASKGIHISDFLELSFALGSKFMGGIPSAPHVDESFFSTVAHSYSADTVRLFLELLSLDIGGARQFIENEDKRVRDFDSRLYEQSPLPKKPLLRTRNGRFVVYSPNILSSCLGNLAYDIMKDSSPEAFSKLFGESFERYVRLGLESLSTHFHDENSLRSLLGTTSRVVDFLIPFQGANVLLESKAIELSPQARVSPDSSVVQNALRSSVIKAIQQGLVVANRLQDTALPGVNSSATTFLLIVTFRNLNLGNSRVFVTTEV